LSFFFQNKQADRRERIQKLLNSRIDHKKGGLDAIERFVVTHYQALVITALVTFFVILHVYYFNILTAKEQEVLARCAQVESALQMRQNLVPALTVVVYQFINHEKNVFLTAVEAREKSVGSAANMDKLVHSLKELTGKEVLPEAVSKFMAVAENYPQLVSSESYQLLISRIADTEKQLFEKRIDYNVAANRYDTYLSTFPANILGRILGFRLKPYYSWEKKSEWEFSPGLRDQGELPVSMKLKTVEEKK